MEARRGGRERDNRDLCPFGGGARPLGDTAWPDVEGIHAENDRPDSPAEEGHRRSISNWDSSVSWPEAGLLPHACSHTVPYRECTRRRSPLVQRQPSFYGLRSCLADCLRPATLWISRKTPSALTR